MPLAYMPGFLKIKAVSWCWQPGKSLPNNDETTWMMMPYYTVLYVFDYIAPRNAVLSAFQLPDRDSIS